MIEVVHVLKTFGFHGGEQQISRMFRVFSNDNYKNMFLGVFRDQQFEMAFEKESGSSPDVIVDREEVSVPILQPILFLMLVPLFWLKMIIIINRSKKRIYIAHGFHAGLVCWLPALIYWKRFAYMHRGTKRSRLGRLPLFHLFYWPFRVVGGVSEASVESLTEFVPQKKLFILPNGIDCSDIQGRATNTEQKCRSNLKVVTIGRLIESKCQKILIESICHAKSKGIDCTLDIIGDGPLEYVLRSQAESLGVSDRVRFLGYVACASDLLDDYDLFLFASEVEGLSNAVLEAMAKGLPSIVVSAPGVSECHIDGVTGFICQRDTEDIIKALDKFWNKAELIYLIGQAARERCVKEYSMEVNAQSYIKLYNLFSDK